MTLEDQLVSLLTAGDLKSLVRAMCACARLQLPRARQVDPFNVVIVETAEAWAAGRCPLPEVRQIAQRAGETRGGSFASACVRVIVSRRAAREEAVRAFGRQLPTIVWGASDAGRAWTAKAGLFAQISSDPKAIAEVAAVDAALAALAARS